MRNNTPPASPFYSNDDDYEEFDENEDEAIYLGDADEVLNALENGLLDLNEDGNSSEDELVNTDEGLPVVQEEPEQPEHDDSVITFRKHTGPVFCGALHPNKDLAVSGGEDDKAYVWTTDTGELILEVAGHSDSVTAVGFSYDGNYLATGDMAGNLQVFKVHQNYKKCWEFAMGDMAWMKWHNGANVLLAGGESGEVYVWRIPSGDCKVLQGNGHKAEVGELMADGKRLIVGYGDGTVKLWDIKTNTTIQEIAADSTFGHSGSVTCATTDPDNNLFLSGSEDGKIMIASSSGPLGNLDPDAGSIESMACCSESDLKILACGTLTGKISLWDVPKQAVRLECENTEVSGVTRLLWTPGQTLLCGTLAGLVKGYDGRSGQLKVILLFRVQF